MISKFPSFANIRKNTCFFCYMSNMTHHRLPSMPEKDDDDDHIVFQMKTKNPHAVCKMTTTLDNRE